MNLSLSGKNALVCGSSKGIGKAAAIELAKLGANITLVSRSPDLLAEVLKELPVNGNGQDHDFLVADFSDSVDLRKKIMAVTSAKSIHILVNNTGGPKGGPIVNADGKEFIVAFNNHLLCNHLLAQALIPGMKTAKFGRIINIISTSVKQPIPNLGVSNTTRGAVANWAKTMANELGQFGITVNNVLPGYTSTARLEEIVGNNAKRMNLSTDEVRSKMEQEVPIGRFAEPSEIGQAIAFLASPAAAYINGVNLPVDGGKTRSL